MVAFLQSQYLQLTQSDDLSRSGVSRLVRQFGSLDAIRSADPLEITDAGFSDRQREQLLTILDRKSTGNEQLRRASNWLQEDPTHRHLVCFEDSHYPGLLKEIACPPLVLFVEGDVCCLTMPQLALVGSRRASSNGEQTANWLAGELVKLGFCITSGLAAGIDSCAHNGALATSGWTIGVLGTGIDRIYPFRNRQLAKRVTGRGALVSEFFLGTPPIPGNFPQRNRIIAGLSLGVIVIEATLRSGSLITARLAMESNREVFAIPGSIHSGTSRGCHRLIKEGAKLVEDVDSVLEELAGPLLGAIGESQVANTGKQVSAKPGLDKAGAGENGSKNRLDSIPADAKLEIDERKLLELMGVDSFPAEVLAARAGISVDRISQVLMSLELKGYLHQSAGRYQRSVSGLHKNSD